MANDSSLPSLALSDIMHPMSPSPAPPQLAEGLYTTQHRDATPEPLTEADVAGMRRRLSEMGFVSSEKVNVSSRERELLDMVLRLTESTLADPSQLIRQAELISELTVQRDFLLRQAEDERDRWASEKDGWARMAEALIAQRHKPGNSGHKEEELERQCASFQSDNRNLRARLLDTQNRLSSLESELKNLKPLLLMQPVPSVSSSSRDVSSSSANPGYVSTMTLSAQAAAASKGKPGRKRKGLLDEAIREQQEASADEAVAESSRKQCQQQITSSSSSGPNAQFQDQPTAGPSSSSGQPGSSSATVYHYPYPYAQHLPPQSSTTQQDQGSRSAQPHMHTAPTSFSVPLTTASSIASAAPSKKQRASKSNRKHTNTIAPLLPLTSDARTEHILLAARRIGRERAGMVAGIMKAVEKEKEKLAREQEAARIARETEKLERERLERLASGTAGMGYYRMDGGMQVPQAGGNGNGGPPGAGHVIGPGQPPMTPKRGSVSGMGASHYMGALAAGAVPPSVSGSNFVFVGTPAGGGYAGSGVMGTPRQVALVSRGEGQQQSQTQGPPQQKKNLPNNPPTPLDSLLSAARSMMDDGAGDAGETRRTTNGNGNGNGRRKSSAIEMPESPLPKRRRVATGKAAVVPDRVRSALDVLADQAAAAFPEADQNAGASASTSTKASGSTAKGRGKGKAKEVAKAQNSSAPGEGGEPSASSAPTKGRPRGTKDKSKPKAPAATTARKPRARPPPRDRTAALSASASTSSTAGTKGKGRETSVGSRSATPRMISPAGPRLIAPGGSGAGGKRSGMSPLDEALPPLVPKQKEKKAVDGGHAPWATSNTILPSRRGSSRLSLRPVVGWGDKEVDEETEPSSPARGSGEGKDKAAVEVEVEVETAKKDAVDVQVEAEQREPLEAEEAENMELRMEMAKHPNVEIEVETDKPPEMDVEMDGSVGTHAAKEKGKEKEKEPEATLSEGDDVRSETPKASASVLQNGITSDETSSIAPQSGRNDSPTTVAEPSSEDSSLAETELQYLEPSVQDSSKPSPGSASDERKAAPSDVSVSSVSAAVSETIVPMEVDSPAPVVAIEDIHDTDAEAEDDDEDAEGEKDGDGEKEKEKEGEIEPVVETQDRPPPSRTPPPGPPPPGPNGGAPPDADEDHDTDADAEGEVDYEAEESSYAPPSGTSLNLMNTMAHSGLLPSSNSSPPPTVILPGSLSTGVPLLIPISLSSDFQGQRRPVLGFDIQDDRTGLPLASADSASLDSYPVATFTVADADANGSIVSQGRREESGSSRIEQPTTGMGIAVSNPTTGDVDRISRPSGVLWVEGRDFQMARAGKLPRSPYVKWTQEEGDLLAEAVARYGQKWDKVQNPLPSCGYHQVRQRWLRKMGLFDFRSDFSLFPSGYLPDDAQPTPKLGLAPLNSEVAFSRSSLHMVVASLSGPTAPMLVPIG